MNTTMPSPDNSNIDEIVLDESSNENSTPSFPISGALTTSFQEGEDEARELAKVIRRMHVADKCYWEESEFLLLQNEVALHTLFQDNKSAINAQCKSDGHFLVEGDVQGCEAKRPCFQESKAVDDKGQRINVVNGEVDNKETDEKWRGAIDNGLEEHNQTTPQSLDVQIIEDRIDKARSDLSFLEQQTTQMETEMKTLQLELAKLKDQLCQTQIQYDK